jgi:hypothetical protein
MKSTTIASFILVIALPIAAQEKASDKGQPKTQLEAFAAETGVVIIKGYSDIGEVVSMGSIAVDCKEFTNAKSGKKSYGMTIKVKEAGRLEREGRSYIDYEEIEALIAGIDYISKINSNVTKLSNFEATYSTKGDFSITVFNMSGGKLSIAVTTGYVGRTSAYLPMEKLPMLRSFIVQAKEKLDALRN